ncbi:M15 family metallopeptidase [Demequina gelatinilytica]|uniref:M15 family metallopeptidase n=1 Tax=Demequina gelatinilytica TaxID=1638980 RepID=UPI000AAF8547|nr:M15 family metallopeptidase [Demequina gelatinilytica]
MRVSREPVYVHRRRRLGAALLVAVVGTLAGFGSAEMASRVLGTDDPAVAALVSSPAGEATAASSTAEATPTPTPTPSPSADAASPVAPTPEPSPTATAAPAFDLTALSVDDPDSLWVVVNKRRPLDPLDYAPADLVDVSGVPGGATMREEAAAAMQGLYRAAEEADAAFSITTGYRDRGLQQYLYNGYVAESGQEAADRFSARPGYSEHQTGLAVDIRAGACELEPCFADTAAGRYVAEHAWEHGFIVRYPAGAEDVTGYIYEPWHLRYVGARLAAHMHDEGIATLEELFSLKAAPEYR